MLQWLQKKKRPYKSESLPLAPDRVVYAVGDIHGRADLLLSILDKIDEDITAHCTDKPLIIFLGDYVDRGDDSAKVLSTIERLWMERADHEYVFLKGNHEAAMLDFLDAPEAHREWLRFGGLQTLHSFGLRDLNEHANGSALVEAAQILRDKLASQEMFLRVGLKLSAQVGNIFFCHAAIDTARRLDDQLETVLLWGKAGFTSNGGADSAWIVHGHTITPEPDIGRNRIGIDTGAYYSGRLTAARISNGNLRFLST